MRRRSEEKAERREVDVDSPGSLVPGPEPGLRSHKKSGRPLPAIYKSAIVISVDALSGCRGFYENISCVSRNIFTGGNMLSDIDFRRLLDNDGYTRGFRGGFFYGSLFTAVVSILGILFCSCSNTDPSLRTEVSAWVKNEEKTRAEADSSLFKEIREFKTWNLDSQKVIRKLIEEHSLAVSRVEAKIKSLESVLFGKDTIPPDSVRWGKYVIKNITSDQLDISWTHDWKDTLGLPERVTHFEVAYKWNDVENTFIGSTTPDPVNFRPVCWFRYHDLPVGKIVPSVRAVDFAGNKSEWRQTDQEGWWVVRIK